MTGIGLAGAALLLVPFLDDPNRWWVPVGLGLGTLVLLALLRLDRLLQGWTWHVAGAVLVAALVAGTSRNPWAWGFAAGVGVLVVGLLRLPRWRVAAAGAVLCVLSVVGYQFRAAEVRQEQAAAAVQAGEVTRQALGKSSPALVLQSLEQSLIGAPTSSSPEPLPDTQAFCRMVVDTAEAQLLAATGTADCPAAVALLHDRVPAGAAPSRVRPFTGGQPTRSGDTTTVDGCTSIWGTVAPGLGRVVTVRTDAPRETWRVAGFATCP